MKKKIIKGGVILLATLLVGFSVLVVHLYMVTSSPKTQNEKLQLARIDFKEPISDAKAKEVTTALHSIDGIKKVAINKNHGTVVYSFKIHALNASDVFAEFMSKGDFNAEAYQAPSMADATGCPVMDESSISYKLSSIITSLFPGNN